MCLPSLHPFQGIGRGARVTFRASRPGHPRHHLTAKVNPLLIFDTHVVVMHGTFGTVVNHDNYVSHR